MNITSAISRSLDGLIYARSALREPRVLIPFAAFSVVQVVILFAIAAFTLPAIAPVMVPVSRFLGGESFLHYPRHLVDLPAVYQHIYLPLVATLGFTLWTLAVWHLVDSHAVGMERPRRAFRPFIPHAVVIGVLFVIASVVTGEATSRLVTPRTPGMVVRALLLASVAITAVAQSFLVYAPVSLRLGGTNAFSAIRAGALYARKNFLATFLVVVSVLLVHMPLDFLLSRAHSLAARFHPETILYLMAGSIVLELITAYLLFACITELALPRERGLR